MPLETWLAAPTVAERYAQFRRDIEPELAAKRPAAVVAGLNDRAEDRAEDRQRRLRQNQADWRARQRRAERAARR